MRKFNLFGIAVITAVMCLTSCGKSSVVKELENCLGNIKTNEDAKKLSKDEAIEIAQCMLPHLEKIKEEMMKLDREQRKKKEKEFQEQIKASDYHEVLETLSYRKVKRLSEQKNDKKTTSSSDNENWDELLDNYEKYTDKYIKIFKKMENDDMSAMAEYGDLLEKAERLEKSLKKAKRDNNLSRAQMRRLLKIENKMIKTIGK